MTHTNPVALPLSQRVSGGVAAAGLTVALLLQVIDLDAPERSTAIARATLQRTATTAPVAADTAEVVALLASTAR